MKRWIITAALGIALWASLASGAFAQAGSTGGTLGNTDKSISGERREEPPTHQKSREREPPAARKASQGAPVARNASACGRIVGTWKWFNDVGVVFKPNGAGEATNGTTATWVCDGGIYKVTWSAGNVDRITIAADGQTLSGISSILGVHISATRE
jgi:hypothetical protein